MSSKGLIAIVASAAAGLVIALPAFGAPTATTVDVTAGKPSELRFTLSKKTVAKGVVTFKVANRGKLEHDFKIAGKKTAKLKPGKTATLKLTLKKGKAAYLCTLPGHAAGGMKGGRHIRFEKAVPLANLHLTLLDKVGVRLDKFADSNGKVDELFEPLGI